jgi:hypothetical protein
MNVAKQTGASDCGLYALATMTCLAVGVDPVTVVFDNEELRPHLAKVLETQRITPFPVKKRRRPADPVASVQDCLIYCYCRLIDAGEKMVCCDGCDQWFHTSCACDDSVSTDHWFCKKCE